MTRILDRLVVASFLKLFAATALGSPLLFILGDATERLDNYLDRGATWADIGVAYVYMYPKFVLWAIPIAALVAAVFTIHNMTNHREIVAAKAGGISFYRIVAPLVVLGAMLAVGAYGLSDLVPTTNRLAAEKLGERQSRKAWRTYFVYQTEDGRSLSVRRLTQEEGHMTGGVLLEQEGRGADEPSTHIQAREARWDSAAGWWTLYDGRLRYLYPEGPVRSFQFDSLRATSLTERPEELLEEPRDEEEMTYAQMDRLARIMRRSGGDPGGLLVEKEQRRALTVATLIIILFGAPLATSSKRGGTAYGIGISLGSTLAYIGLFKLTGAAGAAGSLSPVVAGWLPNAVFLVAGLVLLARVRT